MDLITHAIVGAVTGSAYGHPLAGAVIAAAPDIVLGIKRKRHPTKAYNITHSLPFLAWATALAELVCGCGMLVFWCMASHLFLDIPTHGPEWAPPLFYPFSDTRISYAGEWEFFNIWWCMGLCYSIAWAAVFAAL